MRWKGLEPLQPKAATGSLILRVCQFRHHRKTVLNYNTILREKGQELTHFFANLLKIVRF